jgi:hypothetical protein
MSCMTLTFEQITIGATRCLRSPCYEISLPLQETEKTEFRPLHAHWAVTIDGNGDRRLRMSWHVCRDAHRGQF